MSAMLTIQERLVTIVYNNLGKKSADLYQQFYIGESPEEQLKGAEELLQDLIGRPKTSEQLAPIRALISS